MDFSSSGEEAPVDHRNWGKCKIVIPPLPVGSASETEAEQGLNFKSTPSPLEVLRKFRNFQIRQKGGTCPLMQRSGNSSICNESVPSGFDSRICNESVPSGFDSKLAHESVPSGFDSRICNESVPSGFDSKLAHESVPSGFDSKLAHESVPSGFDSKICNESVPSGYDSKIAHESVPSGFDSKICDESCPYDSLASLNATYLPPPQAAGSFLGKLAQFNEFNSDEDAACSLLNLSESHDSDASLNATYVEPPAAACTLGGLPQQFNMLNSKCSLGSIPSDTRPEGKTYKIKFSGSATVLSRTEGTDISCLHRSKSDSSIDMQDRIPNRTKLSPIAEINRTPPCGKNWLQVPKQSPEYYPKQLGYDLGECSIVVPPRPNFENLNQTRSRKTWNTSQKASMACPSSKKWYDSNEPSSSRTQPKPDRKRWSAPAKRVAERAPDFVPWWERLPPKDNIMKMELGYTDKSWNESNRSSFDSCYDLNKTNLDRSDYGADLSTSFNPHATLVSTPFKRFGRNPYVYNRKDDSFEKDLAEEMSSVYLPEDQCVQEDWSFEDSIETLNSTMGAPYGKSSFVGGPPARCPFKTADRNSLQNFKESMNSSLANSCSTLQSLDDTYGEPPGAVSSFVAGPRAFDSKVGLSMAYEDSSCFLDDSSYDPDASLDATWVQPPPNYGLDQVVLGVPNLRESRCESRIFDESAPSGFDSRICDESAPFDYESMICDESVPSGYY